MVRLNRSNNFRVLLVLCGMIGVSGLGCRGYQYGHIVKNDQPDMVGSHTAGAEVFSPLIEEAVSKLFASQQISPDTPLGPDGLPMRRTIYFAGVENKSAEELGDFKDQIYEEIDTQVNRCQAFRAISGRVVDAALRETRLRPDSLFVPNNMALFLATLQRNDQPIDYILYAKLSSGTTERNSSSQRDYMLTLELVETATGVSLKEQAKIRKGYHGSYIGKMMNYNPFKSMK